MSAQSSRPAVRVSVCVRQNLRHGPCPYFHLWEHGVKHAPLKRRLFAGVAATAIGVIGAVALASPASAHHPIITGEACKDTTGDWVITWTVTNSETDIEGKITSVTVSPDGDISPIAVDAILPKNGEGALTAEQVVPADTTSASLEVTAEWMRTSGKRTATRAADAVIKGDCEPPAASPSPSPSPSPEPEEQGLVEWTVDCEVLSVVINNTFDDDVTLFVVPSVGDTVEVTVPAGETSEPIEFPASAGLTVDVRLEEDGESALEEGAFEIDAEEFAANCDDDGQGGSLPETGVSTGLIAGGAVALLALGAGLFLIARRRRITFTA